MGSEDLANVKDKRWWLQKDDDEAGRIAFAVAVDYANNKYGSRRMDLRVWGHKYNNDYGTENVIPEVFVRDRPSTHNVTGNNIDAIHARITKAQPKPWLVTKDGDWTLYRKAEKLSLWLDGEFERLKLHEVGPDAFHDSAIFGEAWGKVYEGDDGRPAIDLVWIGDLYVDPREERTRKVRTLTQTHLIDKEVLAEQWPKKHRAKIMDSGTAGLDADILDEITDGEKDDITLCVESWRILPNAEMEHVICVEGHTLLRHRYGATWFPFARLPCHRDPLRFWHQGFVQRMSGEQSELDMVSEKIATAVAKSPGPSIWLSSTTAPAYTKVTNEEWSVHTYLGDKPPTFINPISVAVDMTNYRDSMKAAISENHGVSELFAQSKKPAGLNSGKALAVHQDIESERFHPLGKKYERFHVDVAKQLIECAERICDDPDNTKAEKLITMGGEEGLESLKYKDHRISREDYLLRVFPTSALSNSPSGKLQQVADMLNMGLLSDVDDALQLLQMPDIDRYSNERLAARHVVDKKIERTIDGPSVNLPHEHCDLAYAVRWGTLRRDLVENKGAPDDVLDRLDAWIAYAVKLKTEAEAAANPPPPPGAMAPSSDPAMGQPMPEVPAPPHPAMPPMVP